MRKKFTLTTLAACVAVVSAGLLLLAGRPLVADNFLDKMLRAAEQAEQEHLEKMKKAISEQLEQSQPSQSRRTPRTNT